MTARGELEDRLHDWLARYGCAPSEEGMAELIGICTEQTGVTGSCVIRDAVRELGKGKRPSASGSMGV